MHTAYFQTFEDERCVFFGQKYIEELLKMLLLGLYKYTYILTLKILKYIINLLKEGMAIEIIPEWSDRNGIWNANIDRIE